MTALPDAVIESVTRPDSSEAIAADKPLQPPAEITVAPAHKLSRDSVCTAIVSAARANDLPVPFFANLIWQESNFKAGSISPAGAQGIAQFMPQTAKEFGLVNPFEPIQALFTAGKLLRQLVSQFGNLGLAAAAYNAGPKRVANWLGRKAALPGETRDYVRKITGRPADVWTSRGFAQGPDAALMPARAPCWAVADEVEAQVKAANAAKLMAELKATAAARTEPAGRVMDKAAWKLATAKANWKQRTLAMVHELREAAKQRVAGKASHLPVRLAEQPARKATVRVTKVDVATKGRNSAPAQNTSVRRTRYASAR